MVRHRVLGRRGLAAAVRRHGLGVRGRLGSASVSHGSPGSALAHVAVSARLRAWRRRFHVVEGRDEPLPGSALARRRADLVVRGGRGAARWRITKPLVFGGRLLPEERQHGRVASRQGRATLQQDPKPERRAAVEDPYCPAHSRLTFSRPCLPDSTTTGSAVRQWRNGHVGTRFGVILRCCARRPRDPFSLRS
jgi:hypothetical protein